MKVRYSSSAEEKDRKQVQNLQRLMSHAFAETTVKAIEDSFREFTGREVT